MTQRPDRGRDLLFGVIALQMNFVTSAQFVEVMTLLPGSPGRDAPALFAERGYLKKSQIAALGALLEEEIVLHDGDVAESIAAFRQRPEVGKTLHLVEVERTPASDPEAETDTVALPRSPADRYVLGPELGRGGLGRVVLAKDRSLLGRKVAMKLLLPSARDPNRAPRPGALGDPTSPMHERFVEEAQTTAQLSHPNIVTVHELGVQPSGELYYTMPVIGGRTLEEAIRTAHARLHRGEVTAEGFRVERLTLLQSFLGLCHGLSYAHSRGVIHRDVKPGNVMVGRHGETIIVDWGLAKVVRDGDDIALEERESRSDRELRTRILTLGDRKHFETLEGSVTGTPAYMAPEQACGRLQDIDERSDIYALGAVLFEILTGRPPFEGTVGEVLMKVVAGNVPDPRSVGGRAPVPDDLASICRRALSTDRDERYQSVQEIIGDVVLSIEGAQRRAQMHGLCEERLQTARRCLREHDDLVAAVDAKVTAVDAARHAVVPWEPLDAPAGGKRELLQLELDLEEARRRAGAAFNDALVAFAEALAFEPDSAPARRELAEVHYVHMVRAERGRDLRAFQFHAAQAALYDDGSLAEKRRGDGSVTLRTEPAGAAATLYRYMEDGWILKAADGRALGTTPVGRTVLPMGSYLLLLSKPGYRETRVPFMVARLEEVRLDVRLCTDEEIGRDLVHVPAGTFRMGGDPHPVRDVHVPDFFIGRFPVTFGEYCEWLDWLEAHAPGEVGARSPRDSVNGTLVGKGEDGRYRGLDPTPVEGRRPPVDPRLPVFSVSWYDAVAYLAWRSERDGRRYVLPTEAEREKAARGVDFRIYPWGNRFDATLCKMLHSTPSAAPEPVGAYPTDESPYGVRDLAGGVHDWCEDWYDARHEYRMARGGAWTLAAIACRASARHMNAPADSVCTTGFRMVVRPEPAHPRR